MYTLSAPRVCIPWPWTTSFTGNFCKRIDVFEDYSRKSLRICWQPGWCHGKDLTQLEWPEADIVEQSETGICNEMLWRTRCTVFCWSCCPDALFTPLHGQDKTVLSCRCQRYDMRPSWDRDVETKTTFQLLQKLSLLCTAVLVMLRTTYLFSG